MGPGLNSAGWAFFSTALALSWQIGISVVQVVQGFAAQPVFNVLSRHPAPPQIGIRGMHLGRHLGRLLAAQSVLKCVLPRPTPPQIGITVMHLGRFWTKSEWLTTMIAVQVGLQLGLPFVCVVGWFTASCGVSRAGGRPPWSRCRWAG